jgi:nucleotide-binding universal stress UspA family protein
LLRRPAAVDVADTILNHASDTAADLIVMGACGHARLRDSCSAARRVPCLPL